MIRQVTPVSLILQTVLDEDGLDRIIRRVQATTQLATATRVGAAPHNRLTSYRIVHPFSPPPPQGSTSSLPAIDCETPADETGGG